MGRVAQRETREKGERERKRGWWMKVRGMVGKGFWDFEDGSKGVWQGRSKGEWREHKDI